MHEKHMIKIYKMVSIHDLKIKVERKRIVMMTDLIFDLDSRRQ